MDKDPSSQRRKEKNRQATNIYDEAVKTSNLLGFCGSDLQYALPPGTSVERGQGYEILHVHPPLATPGFQTLKEKLPSIEIAELDDLAQQCFRGVERLNTIQSVVYETVTTSDENLLVCAPTGSGKTNIALLSILREVREAPNRNEFKVIYIAPLRALTSEITSKFKNQLNGLDLNVLMVTGEETPPRHAIEEAQVLVVTPEKWEVLTRRERAWEFINHVRLMIFDEVHMLQTDRGPILEAIIVRALNERQGGKRVRIVGLSATLPNYHDVARFLHVNEERGLFYFDQRFRAVPLTQSFIGIANTPKRRQELDEMDRICYEQCVNFAAEDQQVIVFTHSRAGAMELCRHIENLATNQQQMHLFQPAESVARSHGYQRMLTDMDKAQNRDLRRSLPLGFGFHHAGVERRDRRLVERAFLDGYVRVLVSTATLAWGINLPAHAVIIRGTEIYDAQRGIYNELDILDVLQIFGRAGRPQFDTSGHGIIITTKAKIKKYIEQISSQVPIESHLPSKLRDLLNAEVARGTIRTLQDALFWLRDTYFFIRCAKNPLAYGLTMEQFRADPDLVEMLTRMYYAAASDLGSAHMVQFNAVEQDMPLNTLDLGRIAYRYFISYDTVQALTIRDGPAPNDERLTDDVALALIASAAEFSSIQPREMEMEELETLRSGFAFLPIRGGGLASVEGKVNCLLQCYLSRAYVPESTLASDLYCVSDSATRVASSLFEIVLLRKRARAVQSALRIAKCFRLRVWYYDSPLKPLVDAGLLKETTLELVMQKAGSSTKLDEIHAMDEGQLATSFNCDGKRLHEVLRMLPRMEVQASVENSFEGVWLVRVGLTPNFQWDDRLLGGGEASKQHFWVFVEDATADNLLAQQKHRVGQDDVKESRRHELSFYIEVHPDETSHKYQVRVASDRFMSPDVVVKLHLRRWTDKR